MLAHMRRWWFYVAHLYSLNHFNSNKQNNLMNHSYISVDCDRRHGLVYWFERCWLQNLITFAIFSRTTAREKERRKNYKKAHVLVLQQPKGILRRAHSSLIELVFNFNCEQPLALKGQNIVIFRILIFHLYIYFQSLVNSNFFQTFSCANSTLKINGYICGAKRILIFRYKLML